MLLSRGLLAASAGICMVKSVAQLRKNLGERTCDDDGEHTYAAPTLYAALPLYDMPPVYAAIPS